MSTLFEIVAQANAIERQILEANGELSPELESALANVDLAVTEKVDSYSVVISRLDTASDYWKAKAAEYTKLAKSTANASDRIRAAIKEAMQSMGKDEVCGEDVRFKLSKSKASLVIDDMMLDPAYKMVITTHLSDKEKIRSALDAGFEVRGARLEPGTSLRSYPVKK